MFLPPEQGATRFAVSVQLRYLSLIELNVNGRDITPRALPRDATPYECTDYHLYAHNLRPRINSAGKGIRLWARNETHRGSDRRHNAVCSQFYARPMMAMCLLQSSCIVAFCASHSWNHKNFIYCKYIGGQDGRKGKYFVLAVNPSKWFGLL